MNQYDFDMLLQKYLAGTCTPEEEKLVLDWSENMLQHSTILISPPEKEMIRKRIWKNLHAITNPVSPLRTRWVRVAIAAVMVLALASLYHMTYSNKEQQVSKVAPTQVVTDPFHHAKGNIEVKNTSNKPHRIVLEDGSVVILQPSGTLSHPEHFEAKSRTVHLHGDAFFEVTSNPTKPFYVYTGDLVTRVLGTSFNIKSSESGQSIEVSVVNGRVSVYETSKTRDRQRNGIILNPNQKIRFDKDVKVMIPELVEEPVIVHPPEEKSVFIFEETEITKVFAMIQKVYGVEIVIETPDLEACVFTGDINDLPLYSQLKMICKSVNANYELRGTSLFIHGEGCKD
jgi:transmembrane sensor